MRTGPATRLLKLLLPSPPRGRPLWPDAGSLGRLWRTRTSLAYEVPFCDYAARLSFLSEELFPELEAALSLRSDAERDAFLDGFAADYARSLGLSCGVGVSSGTAALTFALLALGVGEGDEVLLPAYTYAATALAVCNAGAAPVFVDAGSSPSTLDLAQLEAKAGPRVRGVIVAHLYGRMDDPAPLVEFCRRKGLFLLEDACQAHGVSWEGRPAGTFGAAAAFSFNSAKLVCGPGNGGLLATGDQRLAETARALRDPETPSPTVLRSRRTPAYLDPLQAACVKAHMGALGRIRARHAGLADHYRAGLGGLPLELPLASLPESPSWHWYVVRTPRRDSLRAFLRRRGIETRDGYAPLPRLEPFRGLPGARGPYPAAERLCAESLALPMGTHLLPEDADRVAAAVADFFKA